MKYKNAFFKIEIKSDGTYIRLYPPFADGKNIDVKEVIEYLNNYGCVDYDSKLLESAIDRLDKSGVELKVSNTAIEPINETAKVTISNDKMVAFVRFYPPSNGGSLMTEKEIESELQLAGVKYGISQKIIQVFVSARQYCLSIPMAKGKKPVPATDTKIEYYFNTKPLAKPKVLEDGSVDFHQLNLFTSVKKGDLLAKLTPHSMGENGIDIFGKTVITNKPKISLLKYGRNITVSEDKTMIYSDTNGDVNITDGTVFVSDTMKVAADVDASTGDIEYEGSVHIPGTVRTGFSVVAKGDIQVDGVVEGANLVAGGNIVIKRGVQGMGKGMLKAKGDICAQFLESSNAEAEGSVIAGSILHSNVTANEKVVVSGKKGFIVGGEVSCNNYVEANSIGNKMETQTTLKVGVKTQLFDEMKSLMTLVNEINDRYTETESYLNVYKTKVKNGGTLSPQNVKQVKDLKQKLAEIEKEKAEPTQRLIQLKEEIDKGKNGKVKVFGTTYRGTTIMIASKVYNVKDKVAHALFSIQDGDIVSGGF